MDSIDVFKLIAMVAVGTIIALLVGTVIVSFIANDITWIHITIG